MSENDNETNLWFEGAIFSSDNIHKSIAEAGFLIFTPVWCVVVGAIMVSGKGAVWGDSELMTLGVFMAIGPLLSGLMLASYTSRVKRFSAAQHHDAFTHVIVMYAGVFALSVGANILQTPFFFDVLHMRFGFKVDLRYDRNPLFLYLVTVAYFATYQAGGCYLVRATQRLVPQVPALLRTFVVATLLAFLETFTNANNFALSVFCYEDHFWALTFGSVAYGIMFLLALPVWMKLGGIPEKKPAVLETRLILIMHTVLCNVAVTIVDAIILAGVRRWIAPIWTTVRPNAGPFGPCLQPVQ